MNKKLFYHDKSIFERFVKELCKKYYGNLEYVSLTPNREFFELVLNVCRELNLTPEKVVNYGIKYLYSDKESIMNIVLEYLNNVEKFGLFENFKEIGRLSLEELSKSNSSEIITWMVCNTLEEVDISEVEIDSKIKQKMLTVFFEAEKNLRKQDVEDFSMNMFLKALEECEKKETDKKLKAIFANLKNIYSIFINAFRDFREENYIIKIENLSKAYEDFVTLYERLKNEEEFNEIFEKIGVNEFIEQWSAKNFPRFFGTFIAGKNLSSNAYKYGIPLIGEGWTDQIRILKLIKIYSEIEKECNNYKKENKRIHNKLKDLKAKLRKIIDGLNLLNLLNNTDLLHEFIELYENKEYKKILKERIYPKILKEFLSLIKGNYLELSEEICEIVNCKGLILNPTKRIFTDNVEFRQTLPIKNVRVFVINAVSKDWYKLSDDDIILKHFVLDLLINAKLPMENIEIFYNTIPYDLYYENKLTLKFRRQLSNREIEFFTNLKAILDAGIIVREFLNDNKEGINLFLIKIDNGKRQTKTLIHKYWYSMLDIINSKNVLLQFIQQDNFNLYAQQFEDDKNGDDSNLKTNLEWMIQKDCKECIDYLKGHKNNVFINHKSYYKPYGLYVDEKGYNYHIIIGKFKNKNTIIGTPALFLNLFQKASSNAGLISQSYNYILYLSQSLKSKLWFETLPDNVLAITINPRNLNPKSDTKNGEDAEYNVIYVKLTKWLKNGDVIKEEEVFNAFDVDKVINYLREKITEFDGLVFVKDLSKPLPDRINTIKSLYEIEEDLENKLYQTLKNMTNKTIIVFLPNATKFLRDGIDEIIKNNVKTTLILSYKNHFLPNLQQTLEALFNNNSSEQLPFYMVATGSTPSNKEVLYYHTHFFYILNFGKGMKTRIFQNVVNTLLTLSGINTEIPEYSSKIGAERLFDPYHPDVGRSRFTVRTLTKNKTFY